MIKLLILADDLTGAMDTGIQFSKYGFSTLVTMELSLEKLFTFNAEVVAVDMETRHADKETTSAIVDRLVREAKSIGIHWIYIKVDSTLRGNIGSEFEAALKASENDKLFFIPAFPAANRITRNAIQYVNDVPLHETIYANDPFTPVTSSFIPDIISEQTTLPIFTVTPENLGEFKSRKMDKSIIVIDAKNEADLYQIAYELLADGNYTLTAGSAGFAMFFPRMLDFRDDLRLSNADKKVLVVCGSLNKTSMRQVSQTEQLGFCSMPIDAKQKRNADYFRTQQGRRQFQEMQCTLAKHNVLILKSVSDLECANGFHAVGGSENDQLDNRQVAKNMGTMIAELVMRSDVDYLVVFGGDTLFGILSHMKGVMINLVKELEPGIVYSTVEYDNRLIVMITKAGGFGDKHTLTNILRYINKQK